MKKLDCCGKPCPAPVIATKKALETSTDGVCVLVDDEAARENVKRFAINRGYSVTEKADGSTWSLILEKAGQTVENGDTNKAKSLLSGDANRILLITSTVLGEGADELGSLLMKNFIFTLLETESIPSRILFLNSGVLLAIQGAETVEALKRLEEMGVEIFSCGICLDFFKKKELLAVGKVTNMFSTAEHLLSAGSVIKL